MLVLGIESSCDETGASIVRDGRYLLSNVVASQIEIHNRYGGVVPEVASRQQLTTILPVIEMAMEQASCSWNDIDAIAATYGPGLAGSLLVGLTVGKTLALACNRPFLGVNHLEAHIYANWLRKGIVPPQDVLAHVACDVTRKAVTVVLSAPEEQSMVRCDPEIVDHKPRVTDGIAASNERLGA